MMGEHPGWEVEQPNSFEKLCIRLIELSTRRNLAFRGQSDIRWNLQSSLDRVNRLIDKRESRDERIANCEDWYKREREFVETFRRSAIRFMNSLEKLYLESWSDKSDKNACWNTIAIARHYGIATRALDWTTSAMIGAYFAAVSNCLIHGSNEPGPNGALWWFCQRELEEKLHNNWDKWGVAREDAGDEASQRETYKHAINPHYEVNWVTKMHFFVPFPRMEAQRGFLTICSRLGKNHCEVIHELGVKNKGILAIPGTMKDPLLDRLEDIGITAASLRYPGADLVAQSINTTPISASVDQAASAGQSV